MILLLNVKGFIVEILMQDGIKKWGLSLLQFSRLQGCKLLLSLYYLIQPMYTLYKVMAYEMKYDFTTKLNSVLS